MKASTKAHHTIVSKLGVSRIVHPEEEMGIRVAQALNYPMVNDYLSIGNGLCVVEIIVKAVLHECAIAQIIGETEDKIDAILVKREQQTFTQLSDDFLLKEHDVLLLCGSRESLKIISPKLG
ncbi:hypothetical protein P4S72_08470 [Vibrio sp. PP-XX7]